jgi:MFS family permease
MWLIGLSVANIGNWMQRIAQDWLVLQLSHNSGTALGLITGVQFLPILLLGPVGGVLADRFPRRQLLLWTQLVVGLCGVVLGALVFSGGVAMWHVYVLAVVLGLANAVFQPTVQAFVMELVTREEVVSVVGLSGGSFHAARLVGPGLAGLLITVGGTGPVFMLAAATVLCPVVSLLRMDTSKLHEVPVDRGKGMLRAGIAYAAKDPTVRVVLGMTAFVGTFALNSAVTTALMATTVFGKGAGEFGLLGSVVAIGSLAGAVLAARRKSVPVPFVAGAAAVFVTLNMLSGLSPGYVSFAVVMVVVGMSQITFITAANSCLQLVSEPHLRGRVMALFMVLTMGTAPIGAPLIGWVAQHEGTRVALVGCNAVALIGIAVVLVLHRIAVRRGRTAQAMTELVEAT